MQVYQSNSVAETERIAADLATSLRGGECIALEGDLGAGKTQFVRGLARGIGANPAAVSSPTFVLLNVYPGGRLTVYHLDAYRVGGADDFDAIGFSELLDQNQLVVVEWPSRVERLLPEKTIRVEIEPTAIESREIRIR